MSEEFMREKIAEILAEMDAVEIRNIYLFLIGYLGKVI